MNGHSLKVLVVHLASPLDVRWEPVLVDCPWEFDLGRYISGSPTCVYNLMAAVCHRWSNKGGHYIAHLNAGYGDRGQLDRGDWVTANDEEVTYMETRAGMFCEVGTCLVFYVREDCDHVERYEDVLEATELYKKLSHTSRADRIVVSSALAEGIPRPQSTPPLEECATLGSTFDVLAATQFEIEEQSRRLEAEIRLESKLSVQKQTGFGT